MNPGGKSPIRVSGPDYRSCDAIASYGEDYRNTCKFYIDYCETHKAEDPIFLPTPDDNVPHAVKYENCGEVAAQVPVMFRPFTSAELSRSPDTSGSAPPPSIVAPPPVRRERIAPPPPRRVEKDSADTDAEFDAGFDAFLAGARRKKSFTDIVSLPREKLENESYTGPGGFALGYQYRKFKVNGGKVTKNTHGIHVDMPLVTSALALPFVYPSLTVEADIGFPSVQVSGGIGPGVHFILPGIFQAYGKLMFDVHAASLGDAGSHSGWSSNAIAGGQIFILYFEGRIPVDGSEDVKGTKGYSGGLRFGF